MSYMPFITAYNGPDQFFINTNQVLDFPFNNHWQNNPLSKTSWIESRRAGYRPYKSYTRTSNQGTLENNCSVYQASCDLILPANKCYQKNPVIITQP